MDKSDNHLFLIDGFPRATDQAKAFEDQVCPLSGAVFTSLEEIEGLRVRV
jgi:adenylate kinase family enzyme